MAGSIGSQRRPAPTRLDLARQLLDIKKASEEVNRVTLALLAKTEWRPEMDAVLLALQHLLEVVKVNRKENP